MACLPHSRSTSHTASKTLLWLDEYLSKTLDWPKHEKAVVCERQSETAVAGVCCRVQPSFSIDIIWELRKSCAITQLWLLERDQPVAVSQSRRFSIPTFPQHSSPYMVRLPIALLSPSSQSTTWLPWFQTSSVNVSRNPSVDNFIHIGHPFLPNYQADWMELK